MKATLCVEYIGEANDAKLGLLAGILRESLGASVSSAVVGNSRPRKPLAAEITGKDPRFGVARKFLQPKWQRKNANGACTRGVELWFVLESGKLYEIKSPVSWKSSDQYFCTVLDDGSIKRLSKDEALKWL